MPEIITDRTKGRMPDKGELDAILAAYFLRKDLGVPGSRFGFKSRLARGSIQVTGTTYKKKEIVVSLSVALLGKDETDPKSFLELLVSIRLDPPHWKRRLPTVPNLQIVCAH